MATKDIDDGRPLRVCDLCGGVDDHPRHLLGGGDRAVYDPPSAEIVNKVLDAAPKGQRDRLLESLMDTGGQDRHLDCCREAGCPTGECDQRTRGAEDKRGLDLYRHLEKLAKSAGTED